MSPRNQQSGFTLIEALVAIAVLLLAIAGPMTIASQGLKTSMIARDKVTAFYLAQEGVELIRVVRDENALRDEDFFEDLDPACATVTGCSLDADSFRTPRTFFNCDPIENCRLYRDDNGLLINQNAASLQRGIFTHTNTGVATPYTRKIRVTGSGAQRSIEVTVSWRARNTNYNVVVVSRVFDQYNELRTP